jgi:hypothetical protein
MQPNLFCRSVGIINESRFVNLRGDQLKHGSTRIPDYCMEDMACELLQWAPQNKKKDIWRMGR